MLEGLAAMLEGLLSVSWVGGAASLRGAVLPH